MRGLHALRQVLREPMDMLHNAVGIVHDGGGEATKRGGGFQVVETVHEITGVGIPIMAHFRLQATWCSWTTSFLKGAVEEFSWQSDLAKVAR